MFRKYNKIFNSTLTVFLTDSNLFEMKSHNVINDGGYLKLSNRSVINFYFNYITI